MGGGKKDVGRREFDLKMTDRVNMRMVGVPESSIQTWAAKFLARGYKITQVDQVETAIAMSKRVKTTNKSSTKQNSKVEKVIKREVSRILTQGTLMDEGFISDYQPHYLFSIKENILKQDHHAKLNTNQFVQFGISFVDCSVAKVYFTSFVDDIKRSLLDTLLIQIQPKEIIFEKVPFSPFSSLPSFLYPLISFSILLPFSSFPPFLPFFIPLFPSLSSLPSFSILLPFSILPSFLLSPLPSSIPPPSFIYPLPFSSFSPSFLYPPFLPFFTPSSFSIPLPSPFSPSFSIPFLPSFLCPLFLL